MAGKGEKRSIVIRKEEVVEGGHHGGAWKVAYADFVTAMMAFFLLMWLLNATTEQQRRGLADYFSPNATISRSTSGYGLPFGGRTPNMDGSLASDRGAVQVGRPSPPMTAMEDESDETTPAGRQPSTDAREDVSADGVNAARGSTVQGTGPHAMGATMAGQGPNASGARLPGPGANVTAAARSAGDAGRDVADADVQAELDRRERASFERAAQQIRDAVRNDPALADLARQLMIDVTAEGLRVQLIDEDRTPMFATGSSALNERARAVLAKVAPVLMRLPQGVAIAGHTDAAPYRGGERTNWDLSADRANATRRLLIEAGLPDARVRSVSGMADREPLLPQDSLAAANRRIAITVLHDPRAAAAPVAGAAGAAAPAAAAGGRCPAGVGRC